MSQNLSNFAQRTALAQQVAGECVAELVSAFSRPINPCRAMAFRTREPTAR
jgi:hypothetical protein